MDSNELRQLHQDVEFLKRQKRGDAMKSVLSAFGKFIPKGIRNPDSTVKNIHLYTAGKGPRRTRLF